MNYWFYIGYCLKTCISMAPTEQKQKYYQCWVLGKFLKITNPQK